VLTVEVVDGRHQLLIPLPPAAEQAFLDPRPPGGKPPQQDKRHKFQAAYVANPIT
jgi:hypothetical protein